MLGTFAVALLSWVIPAGIIMQGAGGGSAAALTCTGADFCEDFEATSGDDDCDAETSVIDSENCTAGATDAECGCDCTTSNCRSANTPPSIPTGSQVFELGAPEADPYTRPILTWSNRLSDASTRKFWSFCMYHEAEGSATAWWSYLVGLRTGAASLGGYGIEYETDADPQLRAACNATTFGTAVAIPLNQWVFIALEYDERAEASGGGGDVRLWVNHDPSTEAADSVANCTFSTPAAGGDGIDLSINSNISGRTGIHVFFDPIRGDVDAFSSGLAGCP